MDRFADRARGARRQSLRRIGLIVAAVAAVAALVWLIAFSPLLVVRDVAVTGVRGQDQRDVAVLAREQVGTPLARLDVDEIATGLEHRFPPAARIVVSRSLPGTLTVDVTVRKAVLALQDSKGQLQVVDASGTAFRTVRQAPAGVPVVDAEDDADVSPRGVEAALSAVNALKVGKERVTRISVSPADLVTLRVGSTDVVWGTAERPELKATIVRALIKKKPKNIDVSAPDTPVTR
ncbi:cell division protein FtsQ/DivIB [Janibacter sp. G1551]|uniref:cell division protein FtsQ/DivIB n=1 Tax=Janibacter sp. G1551 TaxID=3420440 RepID=UPI003D0253C0